MCAIKLLAVPRYVCCSRPQEAGEYLLYRSKKYCMQLAGKVVLGFRRPYDSTKTPLPLNPELL